MVTFITESCQASEVNFFTSAEFLRSSFSRSWATRTAPDTEGLTLPVYLLVLNKYNIPLDSSGGLPSGGTLPGIDIKRMDAIQAIRLSLAESLIQGEWWDLYEDEYGGVKFINVYNNGSPGKTINLDIRLCIPSSTKTNEVDMVIVRGYNPPPERYARPFGEFPDVVPAGSGPVNPNFVTGAERVFTVDLADDTSGLQTCARAQLKTTCTKSYIDPLLDVTQLGPQEKNPFYNVKAFESLITYAIQIDGQPTSNDEAAKVKYEFSNTTTWYFRPTFPSFGRSSLPSLGGCDLNGIQSGGDIVFYKGIFNYTSPNYSDRYGTQWPLVIRPAEILYVGYKVNTVLTTPAGYTAVVQPIPEFIRLAEGSNWIYTVNSANSYDIIMYYHVPMDPLDWDIVLAALGGSGNTSLYVADGRLNTGSDFPPGFSGASLGVLPSSGSLGYLVADFLMSVVLERPSVTVTNLDGEARAYCDSLRVRYAPIILFDPPAPIAYKHKDVGIVKLGNDEQALDFSDSDPTTCQNFEETPMNVMLDLDQGNTLDLSLPFCETVDVCARVAETIFDYQNHSEVQTYTLTCGPNDGPELGAAVNGFDTSLRVQSINYSYQDGSAYTIEVSLAPVFGDVSSFGDLSAAVPKTEDISRAAIVTYTAGDGTNYRVRVKGLGEYNAINTQTGVWRTGEMVTVTIKNNPVEKI